MLHVMASIAFGRGLPSLTPSNRIRVPAALGRFPKTTPHGTSYHDTPSPPPSARRIMSFARGVGGGAAAEEAAEESARDLIFGLLKEDDAELVSPFQGIDKAAVVQEVRVFNENKLRVVRCVRVLVRLMYLVHQGTTLSKAESTDVFFAVTKLFSCDDAGLRRLTYLAIKELARGTDEVIIVTNCLTKDITSTVDTRRANATRVLCRVTDAAMVAQIERYLKQELVDRNANVASAALVGALTLLEAGKGEQTVRRWSSEVTQALTHPYPMVQYHALALLYRLRRRDRLALSKLVQDVARQGARSPLTAVLLLRCVGQVIEAEGGAGGANARQLISFLESMLRHRSDMVIVEAARVLSTVRGIDATDLQPAVNAMQIQLASGKPVARYAAVRTLNQIAARHPHLVSPANNDIENLVADANRSVATLAITTLLRTGTESSVDRLLKSMNKLLNDLSDDFKVTVIEAVRALTLKYPHKHHGLVAFLGNALRDEGGLEFKRAVVDTLFIVMREIPDAKEACLHHLVELVEDCEFAALSVRVLHVLGTEGPQMPQPAQYVRHIYNRIILENPVVRAAAVSALFRFARVSALRDSIALLLRHCLLDNDDEVRDRAALYLEVLGEASSPPLMPSERVTPTPNSSSSSSSRDESMVDGELPVPPENLQAALVSFLRRDEAERSAFDVSKVSKVPPPAATARLSEAETGRARPSAGITAVDGGGGGVPSAAAALPGDAAAAGAGAAVSVSRHPLQEEFLRALTGATAAAATATAQLPPWTRGRSPFKSSTVLELTDAEAEFLVAVMKHVYEGEAGAAGVLLQFRVENTLDEQVLAQCRLPVDASELSQLAVAGALPPTVPIACHAVAWTYVWLEPTADAVPPCIDTGTLRPQLAYVLQDAEEACLTETPDATAAWEDEYGLEEFDLDTADYLHPVPVRGMSFKAAWEALDERAETSTTLRETFALPHESVAAAVKAVIAFLGMAPCEGTERVSATATEHVLLLSGVFVGNAQVLCRGDVSAAADAGVNLEVMVRSERPAVSEIIMASIA